MPISERELLDIAERIKTRRIQLGLSYQDMADRTGMSKSTLQRYETGGIANIPIHRLKDIARALEVTTQWILGTQPLSTPRPQLAPLHSDKGTRLSCRIDSTLYNELATQADKHARTLEDEIEDRLYKSLFDTLGGE